MNALLPKDVSQTPRRSVTASWLIKEEPPDPSTQRQPMYPQLQASNAQPKLVNHAWTPTIMILARDDESILELMGVHGTKYPIQIREKSLKVQPSKPSQMRAQGKVLNSQSIMDTNLLYLHAGRTILRTKSSQGGGNDEDIQPTTPQGTNMSTMKAHGITTTFRMGCTGCTAGLDPVPIGNSGSILKAGTVAPKLLQQQAEEEMNKPPDKGDMENQSLKRFQEHTKSSKHLLALKVHSLRHILQEDEDPERPVEDQYFSSHHKAIKEHLVTIFSQLSTKEGPPDYDHPGDLFRTKEAYNQDKNSQDTIFWVLSPLGSFNPKPSPLRQVWLQLVSLFFSVLRTTFEDSKGTRDYHLISWLYWTARRIKD